VFPFQTGMQALYFKPADDRKIKHFAKIRLYYSWFLYLQKDKSVVFYDGF